MHQRIAILFVALLSFGCGDSNSGPPLDFTGQYTGPSTNGASTCPGAWNTGQMADGQINVVQSGDDVQFQAQGGTGLVFLVAFGSASFSGKALGNHVDAVIVGSVPAMQGACSYTWKGTMAADLSGDVLTGTLTQTPAVNATSTAECDTEKVTGCTRITNFSYTRPKK
jgi:hypothetical protein